MSKDIARSQKPSADPESARALTSDFSVSRAVRNMFICKLPKLGHLLQQQVFTDT
jgi:hypothetical protein